VIDDETGEELLRSGRVDGRKITCRKWVTIDGKRTSCGKPRYHEDLCTWETVMMTDGSPWADAGPYEDVAQAMKHFATWATDKPVGQTEAARLKVLEAAMLAGIVPTKFEQDYLEASLTDPILATILHGWLLRGAHPYLLRRSGALNKTVDMDTEAG
jgi:hypothetical protein